MIGATLRGEELCEDEGCPQHGTLHVCNPATGDGRVLPGYLIEHPVITDIDENEQNYGADGSGGH